jgi:hypothetical protein
MPTSLTTTYLVPAILLNPAFILHLFNTFISHMDPTSFAPSTSPHRWLERLGPVANSEPYLDMHANDQLCWSYTIFMVLVQLLAFGRVSDNRVKRRAVRAAKKERERQLKVAVEEAQHARREAAARVTSLDGAVETAAIGNGVAKKPVSGHKVTESRVLSTMNGKIKIEDPDESPQETSETSEEETII